MDNKTQIFQTALTLFAEQGYDRTPTSQIAKAAGVSEGLIFRHYGSKAGLLQAIIQEGMEKIAATMQSYAQTGAHPREAILQHIESAFTAIQEQEAFWQLATKIRFQPAIYESSGAQIAAVNTFIIRHLTENFAKLGAATPALEALHLFAEIDGICLHWLQSPGQYPIQEMKQFLLEKYQRYDNTSMGQ